MEAQKTGSGTTVSSATPRRGAARHTGSVQSLDRAFELLEHLADADGVAGITQLTVMSGLPLPTVHRLLRSLITSGYVRQGTSRRYSLGPRLIRLGRVAGQALGFGVQAHLDTLAKATGETSNLALLDADDVLYVAQAPSRYSMRMFTEVGRRVHAHCTGVGKALLAQLSDDQVLALVARTGMPASTSSTITDASILIKELGQIRRNGYAIDNEEQEVGVRCIAAAIPGSLARAAISVSGPPARLDAEATERIIPLLKNAADDIAASIVLPSVST
jgi:IclR family transcriptional regulator, acetate operon repressor